MQNVKGAGQRQIERRSNFVKVATKDGTATAVYRLSG
jgi:hypothetical protein